MKFYLGLGSKVNKLFVSSPAKKGENPDAGLDVKSKLAASGFDIRSPGFVSDDMDSESHCEGGQLGSLSGSLCPVLQSIEGSKEETFFDSRAWLDSDCEDDFHSVNGEFTPSRGSTPNYQTSIPVTLSLNKALLVNKFPEAKSETASSETSPTGRKKLGQLLRESLLREQASNEDNAAEENVENDGKSDVYSVKSEFPPKSIDGTPYRSGSDSLSGSEVTPNRDSNRKKMKRWRSISCCLPSLVHSFSFNERRQKMSPVPRSA